MKVLIFGENGQVGFELTQLFDQVVSYTRQQVDFSIPGQITSAVQRNKPDVVINAVAYTAVDKAQTEPSLAMQINAVAVQELARACKSINAWCVHYSTDYVFDGSYVKPYKESNEVSPLGIYGQTKRAGEEFIQQETDKYIIFRTSWVYSYRGANFVKTMLRLAKDRDELNVVADQVGCPTYAPDIAKATASVISTLSDNTALSGIYHLTGSDSSSWFEFAKAVFQLANIDIKVNAIATEQYPTPAQRPKYSILDNHKLAQTFSITVPGYKSSLSHCLNQIELV